MRTGRKITQLRELQREGGLHKRRENCEYVKSRVALLAGVEHTQKEDDESTIFDKVHAVAVVLDARIAFGRCGQEKWRELHRQYTMLFPILPRSTLHKLRRRCGRRGNPKSMQREGLRVRRSMCTQGSHMRQVPLPTHCRMREKTNTGLLIRNFL